MIPQNTQMNKEKLAIANRYEILILVILLIPLIIYGRRLSWRSPRTNIQEQLFPGVVYQRKIFSQPRPYILHLVAIDLSKPNIKPFVTPPNLNNKNKSNSAMTTSLFVKKFDLQLGINGSFFSPFKENTPTDFYPKNGDLVDALGENISNRQRYGRQNQKWNILCFSGSNTATIAKKSCPIDTVQGIAGNEILVDSGKSIIGQDTENYSRSAVGIDGKNRLWLIVVDGKQPFYSEGVSLKELADIFVAIGCDRALNLDGGGSSTLVMNKLGSIAILNAPTHTKIPMRERPVANHLGFKLN